MKLSRSNITPRYDGFVAVSDADGVSATANTAGFAPIGAVAGGYDWDRNLIHQSSYACNIRGEICVLAQLCPQGFLVPRTRGRMDNDFLINDLLDALERQHIRKLHFTHFMFLRGPLPEQEIRMLLETFRDRDFEHLREIVIDVDSKFLQPFQAIFDSIFPGEGTSL